MRITRNERVLFIAQPYTTTYAIRIAGWWIMLKGPRNAPLFSERNRHRQTAEQRATFKRIPLLRGWRITARKVQ